MKSGLLLDTIRLDFYDSPLQGNRFVQVTKSRHVFPERPERVRVARVDRERPLQESVRLRPATEPPFDP